MFELTLNAEMAVKLIKLKKQAQIELGQSYSIGSEEDVEQLLLAAATFQHKHSKARLYALELIDGVEALDNEGRHTEFIAVCRGQIKETEEELTDHRIYRGNKVLDDAPLSQDSIHSERIYRGQVVLDDSSKTSSNKQKTVYYRGQKVVVTE